MFSWLCKTSYCCKLKFELGEEVSLQWTDDEEKIFKDIMSLKIPSQNKSFWNSYFQKSTRLCFLSQFSLLVDSISPIFFAIMPPRVAPIHQQNETYPIFYVHPIEHIRLLLLLHNWMDPIIYLGFYEERTLLRLGVSRCRTRYNYTYVLCNFFQIISCTGVSVSMSCPYPCFMAWLESIDATCFRLG